MDSDLCLKPMKKLQSKKNFKIKSTTYLHLFEFITRFFFKTILIINNYIYFRIRWFNQRS